MKDKYIMHHICYTPPILIKVPVSEHQSFHHRKKDEHAEERKIIMGLIVDWVACSWILSKTPVTNSPKRYELFKRIEYIKKIELPKILEPYEMYTTPAFILKTGLEIVTKREGRSIHNRFIRLRNLQINPKCEGI